MKISEKDNHTVITAEDGYFLKEKNGGLYGFSISLGVETEPDAFEEKPISQAPESLLSELEQNTVETSNQETNE